VRSPAEMPFTLGLEGGKKRQGAIGKHSCRTRQRKRYPLRAVPSGDAIHFVWWNSPFSSVHLCSWHASEHHYSLPLGKMQNSTVSKNAVRDKVSLRKYSLQSAMHRAANFNFYRIAIKMFISARLNSGICSWDVFSATLNYIFFCIINIANL